MKVVIQRSLNSNVIVENVVVGKIDKGLVLFVCFESDDDKSCIVKSVQKIINLRIFEDSQTGKMSHNISDSGGSVLAISQFTLSWDGKKGNRPSFDRSMEPQLAKVYFKLFCDELKKYTHVETGSFGKAMKVSITNDGPVTFCLNF